MAKTASARWKIPALPDDLFLWEILIRLPATTLHRCREVCRSWRRLTSAADFLLAHHRRQPSLPLVAFDGDELQCPTLDSFDLRQSPAERRPVLLFLDANDFVQASCDGLLLLSLSDGRFSICNPVTRQSIVLPSSLTGANIVGMYLHSSSGEYRVLYWKSIGRAPHLGRRGTVVYYVLTVGSSAEPRCIGLPVASPPSVEQFAKVGLTYGNKPPVLHRSCLHWGRSTLKSQLIVFDTVAESFRCMRSPITTASYHCARSRLLEMDGLLGISHLRGKESVVELWVLDDYELEVWSLKYRIELPEAQLRSIAWNFNALVVSDNGDVLVYFGSDLHLFHCNCYGDLLQDFPLDRAISWPLGYWFKESLVRHTFFQRN